MYGLLASLTAGFLLSTGVCAQTQEAECSPSKQCPSDRPCCSQYGQCGVGAFCLGGCDPKSSFKLSSCMPAPVCQDKHFKFNNLDGVMPNTEYLGDSSKADWSSSGEPKMYSDENGEQMLLTMAKGTVGTLLASTDYVWYGKVSAKMKSSRDAGVVTAFILLSDVKDEVDFEFVGTDLQNVQSNYYFQGYLDYTHGKNITVPGGDTFSTYHTYEIDWTPDQLVWSVDGDPYRTIARNTTYNETTKNYNYPQTPARVQLSLWPAGLPTNGKGTIDWAGGEISWDTPDVKNAHYYYAMVQEVTIQCYNPPSDAQIKGSKSYTYSDTAGTENTVVVGDQDTILGSFDATGDDPNKGKQSASPSAAKTGAVSSGASQPTDTPQVPGLSGTGTGANGGRSGSSGSGDGSSSGGSSGGSGTSGDGSGSGTSPQNPSDTGFHGFTQGSGAPGTGAAAGAIGEGAMKGSMFAVLVAIAAVLVS